MSEDTLGYVELEWTCEACGSRNRGTTRVCASCGAAMSEDAKFDLPAEQKLIADPESLAKVGRGPDRTCAYCGTRNPADAKLCSQCGADLAEATARQQGEVLGAFSSEAAPEVTCQHCGELNPASALKCRVCGASVGRRDEPPPTPQTSSKGNFRKVVVGGLVGVLALLMLCGLGTFGYLALRTTDVEAYVKQVSWERQIEIMEERPVTHEAWQDQVPAGAVKGDCEKKTRSKQSSPAPNSIKVCGTPYVKNQGDGTGKVVQDCVYEVEDLWCDYTQDEWKVVDQATAKGKDFNPNWPEIRLKSDQREGKRHEGYQVVFAADGGKQYEYSPRSLGDYQKFVLESRWILQVNGLGSVNSVALAK